MSRNTNNTLYSRYRRWRRYRETVRELKGLSSRELNDLGICPPGHQPAGARGFAPLTGSKCQRTGRGRQSPAGLFIFRAFARNPAAPTRERFHSLRGMMTGGMAFARGHESIAHFSPELVSVRTAVACG